MTPEILFHQARFNQVKKLGNSDIYTLGAHVFTGEHQKAHWLAESLMEKANLSEKAFIQFHLGLSYTRTSRYKKAAQLFKTNLRWAKENPQLHDLQFFAWQGLGFFNFFFSRHEKSLKATFKAHHHLTEWLRKEKQPLYLVMCLDLEGHNLIYRNRIHQGVEVLREALSVATENNIESFSRSLEFSLLLYEAQYLMKPIEAIEKLKEALSQKSADDDYSRSELVCLISNSLMLSGQFKESQDFLSEHYKVIYKTDNKRQMGQLNFRMTYAMYRRGSFEQALYLAKTARSNLNPVTDRSIISKILGLEIQILEAMGEPTESAKEELSEINEKIDSLLVGRANYRSLNKEFIVNKGEDVCGDIIERLYQKPTPQVYKDLIKHQMYGMLFQYFELKPGQEAIVVNTPDQSCVSISKDLCHVNPKPLGQTLLKLLLQLAEGQGEKEHLISRVWGYSEYDPLRHDHLIYSAVARLRSLLQLSEEKLFFDGEAYRLGVNVVNWLDNKISHAEKDHSPSKGPESLSEVAIQYDEFIQKASSDLNYRQIHTLKDRQIDNISVKIYADRFDVTTMTALRDLKKLSHLGYMKKMGAGRATRYLKTFS